MPDRQLQLFGSLHPTGRRWAPAEAVTVEDDGYTNITATSRIMWHEGTTRAAFAVSFVPIQPRALIGNKAT